MFKNLCVVGLGYIGLPTAVMFANHQLHVHGVDINEKAVKMIQNKQLHIEENGLQERMEKAIDEGFLTVGTQPEKADVFIVAVPSPINSDNTANLEYVRKATASIVPFLEKGNLVILESTVPPKTVEDVMLPELIKSGLEIGTDILVSHSPERVIPGKIFEELINNDRIVGGINEESSLKTKELYEIFVKGQIHLTDATTAELVKVMENTYRDVNIAFANELAKMADRLDVNVWEAIKFANYHPRVNVHFPGPGVGGHCIAVDPWFLVELQPETAKLIHLSRNTNDGMPAYVASQVQRILTEQNSAGKKIAVFGLAFKGNVDDMRESPSTDVIDELQKLGMDVISYDPHIKENLHHTQVQGMEEALRDADLLIILTNHDEFTAMDPKGISDLMRSKTVYDTKNCLDRTKWMDAGFASYLLGNSK
ncbi:nucleotide sugar dehydrogenase [Planococcus beigongshangi]|uniref:nucleotide sugar dehydrogenase n=1 Tax=Planococcus beigongshangi TaxID=2782536 RepID=UPI00193C56E5|nr:nucleotide sugar dehydrogenase [Planococcus beigongshangi]